MTNPTPDALLPCPFCGGGNIAYVTNGDREWTTCDDCLSEGPDAATQDEAIAAWNRRAGQSHDAGLLAALEPFAKALGKAADDPRWADDDTIEYDGFAEFITVGDLRRARAAIAALGAGGRDAG